VLLVAAVQVFGTEVVAVISRRTKLAWPKSIMLQPGIGARGRTGSLTYAPRFSVVKTSRL